MLVFVCLFYSLYFRNKKIFDWHDGNKITIWSPTVIMSNHQDSIVMIDDAASASAEIIKCSTNERARARVRVDRPAYTNRRFEDEFRVIEQEDTHDGLATDQRNPSPKRSTCCRRFETVVSVFNPIRIFRLFTIFEVFANYKCRLYLASDIMSGITGLKSN